MRICKVWDADYPWDVRVEKVARSLSEAGHDVHLVARNRRRAPIRERLAEADVHRLQAWPMLGQRLDAAAMFPAFFNPRWISAIARTARASRADVLLVRDLPLAPTAVWIGRRLGIPVVLDMAENYPAMMRGLRETGVARRGDFLVRNPSATAAVERWVLARIDHVLVVIEESRERLEALGVPPDRISVVGNTPPLARLGTSRPRLHEARGPLELIYLGLLEAPRGLGLIIDALSMARGRGLDARLTVVGDGRERPLFESQARALGLGDEAIRFLGRVPHAEALRLIQSADVGLVPHKANESWNTTIPNKLFDYMAVGLPVLTSSAKPAARVVREADAGLVFRDGDVADCAAAMTKLMEPQLRAHLGASGRRAVAARFHWEQDAGRMLEAMDRVVAAGARS